MSVSYRSAPIYLLIGIMLCVVLARSFAAETSRPGSSAQTCTAVGLDSTFGNGGKVVTSFHGGEDTPNDVAVQSDGKIVVAGTSGSDFALLRYNPNGTLDATFGNDGRVNTNFPLGASHGAALVIQPDGKIVVAGGAIDPASTEGHTRSGFALVRYNTNGSLDTSFDGDGRVVTPFGDSYTGAEDIVLQPDGKLVVAGTSLDPDEGFPPTPPSITIFALARYNTDGSLDTSFDADGRVTTDIPGLTRERAQAVAVQANGRIVAAGVGPSAFVLTRYNTNGSLDSGAAGDSTAGDSFGTTGIVTTAFGGGNEDVRALAIQPDGKIIAAGQTASNVFGDNGNFALARYNLDGSLDNTFDTDGKVTTDFGLIDAANDVVIQPDGRIVAAGSARTMVAIGERCDGNCHGFFALARYNPNGLLDNTFDGDGRVTTTDFFGDISKLGAMSVALQADGRIVAAGDSNLFGQRDFGAVRYNMDGSLDTANFGTGGMVTTDFSLGEETISGMVVQPDGKIVAAGRNLTLDSSFLLARYNVDGTLDQSFGTGGRVSTGFTVDGIDRANAVALQTDGKIVVVGQVAPHSQPQGSADYAFGIARYNSNGTLDATFDGDGKAIVDIGTLTEVASAVAIQSDGKIVVAGTDQNNFALTRLNTDGSLDSGGAGDMTPGDSFGTGGKTITDFGTNYLEWANAVVIQTSGKIVAGGTAGQDFALARYTVDGNLDTASFGAGGKVMTNFANFSTESIAGLIIQPDGKLVAAGNATIVGTGIDFALARYSADGVLDAGFGTDGKVTTDFGGTDGASSLALQADGRIVAAGGSSPPFVAGATYAYFALARYNTNGTLDSTFGTSGKIITDFFGINNGATSVVIQGEGKIIAGGVTDGGSSQDFALARYSVNCPPVDISVAVSPSSVAEDGAGNLVYTLTRAGDPSAPLTINFSVFGTARFNIDYSQSGAATFTATEGTVTFVAGSSTVTITIDPTADIAIEENESVTLTVASATDGGSPSAATGTITNDDSIVSFSQPPSFVAEDSANNLVYYFLRNGNIDNSLTVNFLVGGTATFNTDYSQTGAATFTSSSGTVTFGAGDSVAIVRIDPTADNTFELNETVVLTVTSGSGYTIGGHSVATGTIDNDDTFTFNFSLANYTVSESGGSVQITVTRTTDVNTATVDFKTTDNSNPADFVLCSSSPAGIASSRCDFNTALGTLKFVPGETAKTFNVLITQDSYVEGTESLQLFLSNPIGFGVLGAQSTSTLQIQDDVPETTTNPILDARNFVRQNYHDFLNREPDQLGWDFWTDNITKCNDPARRPAGQTLEQCIDKQMETTSAAFFLSPEFQYTGFYIYCVYKGSLGRSPTFLEFMRDVQQVSRGIIVNNAVSGAIVEQNRAQFETEFTLRGEFFVMYSNLLSHQGYVDKLFQTTGTSVSFADRQALVTGMINGTETRATVLHKVVNGTRVIAEGQVDIIAPYGKAFTDSQFTPAFVQMEYFGYLRRNSDPAGFTHWRDKMNFFGGDFLKAEMVKSFLVSPEYLQRFAAP